MSVKHYPQLVNAYELASEYSDMRGSAVSVKLLVDGRQVWVPARALGFYSWRSAFRLAWGVFMGRYDALVWPGQGDA